MSGRKVVLYPDAGCFDKWNEKAKELSSLCSISVSRLLEDKVSIKDKEHGYDLADYLVQYDYRVFQDNEQIEKDEIPIENYTHTPDVKDVYESNKEYPEKINNWIAHKGPDERIYFANPFSDKLTVYPSINSYNSRNSLPTFEKIDKDILDNFQQLILNQKTLKIESHDSN